ncbi:ribose-phosphate diphosphokinase [bacterium]|nr:ribose-phosphate diphosphokinase [bacterium]
MGRLKIFSGRWGMNLSEEICHKLGITIGKSSTVKFKNGNSFVKIEENVRDMDCFLIHCIGENVNDDVMEMLIMVDALRRASADRITVVVPYYFYARSDKKDQPRISITARLLADLLESAGIDRVLTMDLHSEQIMGFFKKPVDQVSGLSVLCQYFSQKNLENLVVVAPDAGGAKRARSFSWALGADLAIIDKKRIGNEDKTISSGIIGDVAGKTAIIIDDEIDTGGSIVNSIDLLIEAGAKDVYAACTHPVFSSNCIEKLTQCNAIEVVVTNSVPIRKDYDEKKIVVLTVADVLSKSIDSIHTGTSVSSVLGSYKY